MQSPKQPKWFPTHPGELVQPAAAFAAPGLAAPSSPARSPDETIAGSQGSKVLIADPEQRGRAQAVRIISDHRMSFSVASDATVAVDLAAKHDYALVIVDAALLTKDAGALARALRKHRNRPEIIVTSRDGSKNDERLAAVLDARHFFTKPLLRDHLHLVVERYLQR